MFLKLSKFFTHAAVFAPVLVTLSTLFPFIVGKYAFFRGAVDLAIICLALAVFFEAEAGEYLPRLKEVLRAPLTICILAFAAIFILAGIFGIRPGFSFFSNFERGEGGLQVLHLTAWYILMVTLFRRQDWKRILWSSLIAGALSVIYGIMAGFGMQSPIRAIGPEFGAEAYRFSGSIGNPAYMAAYAIFLLFYIGVLAFEAFRARREKGYARMVALGVLALIFLYFGLYLSGTRGAFLGLMAGIITTLFVLAYIRRSWRKWLIGSVIVLVLLVSAMVAFRRSPVVENIPGARIFDISFGAETFATRRVMWSVAWSGWKERPILGWGPENYLMVFDRHFNPDYFVPSQGFGAWFDRAHSVIFDHLVETGILGLAAYLSMFGAYFRTLVRPRRVPEDMSERQDRALRALAAGVIVAYLVQGLILFDVLTIYINYFLVFAFVAHRYSLNHAEN